MENLDAMIDRAGESIVKEGVAILLTDVHDVFAGRQEYDSAEMGASLSGTKPLAEHTVNIKREAGSPTPDLPRVRFGGLIGSLSAEFGGLTGEVSMEDDDEKMIYQMETRPFFGVISKRALDKIETAAKATLEKMVAELDRQTLQPVIVQQPA